MCSELSRANHMDKAQYLLRCHVRYIARLLQLSLYITSVDQQRGDENTQSTPLRHKLAAKLKLVNNFFFFFLLLFVQARAPFSWESFTCWPTLTSFDKFFLIEHRCAHIQHNAVEADDVQICACVENISLHASSIWKFYKPQPKNTNFFIYLLQILIRLKQHNRSNEITAPTGNCQSLQCVMFVCVCKCWSMVTFLPCQSPTGIPW